MTNLYIGGGRRAKKGGFLWKLSLFFFFLLVIAGAALKVSAPFLAERWVNKHGTGKTGYAYSVRDVELLLKEGEVLLRDVKVFHPQKDVALVKSPSLKLKMKLQDLFDSSGRRISVSADKLDVFVSEDLNSELTRISNSNERKIWYFTLVEAKFYQVNGEGSKHRVTHQSDGLDYWGRSMTLKSNSFSRYLMTKQLYLFISISRYESLVKLLSDISLTRSLLLLFFSYINFLPLTY